MNESILCMKDISKRFPGVQALDSVNLEVKKGTVHAVMGENGAGKSTLMKILLGMYQPDSGSIFFKGKKYSISGPQEALKRGISMIHQELTAVPQLAVYQNLFLGKEMVLGNTPFLDKKGMARAAGDLFEQLGLNIEPRLSMGKLSIANMQMVEIAKAISYNSDLIIMDEPTSAITESEVDRLFGMIAMLKEKGVSIIYITHKMDEVFRISDEISVYRDGKYIGTDPATRTSSERLIEMMVGRELKSVFPKEEVPIGETLLEVRNLSRTGEFEDVSFTVRKGEIFGVAGLMGSGRTEVMETVFGKRRKLSGEIFIDGKKVDIRNPGEAKECGLALLTEDRKMSGCFLTLPVKENMVAAASKKFSGRMFLRKGAMKNACDEYKNKLSIKTPSLAQKIGYLSGGNQQKVLIARWLMTDPDILILDEPTRGIDVGAKSEIHRLMTELARQGKAVIMISSELPEILGMSDRIMVMSGGRVTGILDRSEADQPTIMRYATGLAGRTEVAV